MTRPLPIGEPLGTRDLVFRPRGVGRFFSAAFLAFWLCGWAAGEAFALWILVRGAMALITGTPLGNGVSAPALGAALVVGPFLMFWLTFWTIGGVLAIRELLRSLWARDRVTVRGGEIIHEARLGPFHRRRTLVRSEVRDVSIARRTTAILVDTTTGAYELTRLGTRQEREAAVAWIRNELRLDARSREQGSPSLPEGWREVLTPEGAWVLVQDPAIRARQARVAGGFTLAVVTGTAALGHAALSNPGLWPGAILGAIVSAALGWGTAWLAYGRMEWRIASGRLVLQRRFHDRVRERFEATAIELTMTPDSDGDEWFAVEALAPGAPASSVVHTMSARKHRRTVHRTMNEDAEPRRISAWLARRASLPLTDRTTPVARSVDLAELRAALAASGRFGRFAARWLERLEKKRGS